jgi:hypothetical protein
MVETRELQAKQLLERAEEMRSLLDVLEVSSENDTEPVDAAFIRAVQQGRAERYTSE